VSITRVARQQGQAATTKSHSSNTQTKNLFIIKNRQQSTNVHPRHHLVAAGVGGFVEVDDAVLQVLLEGPRQRGAPDRQRRVVAGPDVQLVIILQ
jgi:hypothetical protein